MLYMCCSLYVGGSWVSTWWTGHFPLSYRMFIPWTNTHIHTHTHKHVHPNQYCNSVCCDQFHNSRLVKWTIPHVLESINIVNITICSKVCLQMSWVPFEFHSHVFCSLYIHKLSTCSVTCTHHWYLNDIIPVYTSLLTYVGVWVKLIQVHVDTPHPD